MLLASRETKPEKTLIKMKGKSIGGDQLAIIAGPCSIESEMLLDEIGAFIASLGVGFLRGGAYKPRTSPYEFQGLGEKSLRYMQRVAERYGLVSVSEVMDTIDVEKVAESIDILQIGARNMHNYALLKAVGKVQRPVLLKRGFSATYKEVLLAAEYILQAGNSQVILCERGVRTFESHTRNLLDIAAIPVLQQLSHLPVIVDPSHGTGIRELVSPMTLAGIAAGADGVMIEVHPHPEQSISDAQQTISFEMFADLMQKVVLNRPLVA